jgi:hypothetical protein
MRSKSERKEKIKKIESWCVEKFNWLATENIDEVLTFDELIKEFRLSVEYKVDDGMMRSGISRAIKRMRLARFVVFNKRKVGYKIANKFEAMDSKERQIINLVGRLVEIQRPYLNHTLSEDDIAPDVERQKQHMVLQELISMARKFTQDSGRMLMQSPFYKQNVKSNKLGSDIDVEMKEEDQRAREDEFNAIINGDFDNLDPDFVGDKYI